MFRLVRAAVLPVVLLVVASAALPALPLDVLTDGELKAALLRGELLSETRFDAAGTLFMPRSAPVRAAFDKSSAELSPSMVSESVFLYKKPAAFAGGEGGECTEAEMLRVLNTLSSISSLAGLQYYSASRKAMRVFYEESEVVNNPQEKAPVADPLFADNAPPAFTLYARQKDLTFGDNVYRYDYAVHDNALVFTQTNCTPLRYGIIPVVPKEA
ncbi:MAG: hypothetical protein LBH18_07425, partial [Spirochaetaceae bacterium]|nr:hypothetical protein [Spirochaetaceae bacterium]